MKSQQRGIGGAFDRWRGDANLNCAVGQLRDRGFSGREERRRPKAGSRAGVSTPPTRDWRRSSRGDERLASGSRAQVAGHIREVGRWYDRPAERKLDLLDRHVVEQRSGALADHAVRDVERLGCGATREGGEQVLTAEETQRQLISLPR